MADQDFREFFLWIAEQYALTPDAAEALLQRILTILSRCDPENEYS